MVCSKRHDVSFQLTSIKICSTKADTSAYEVFASPRDLIFLWV